MAQALLRPEDEVRRCAGCGQPAMVVVNAWRHSYSGVQSNSFTLDCQCQSCGAKITLHARARIIGMWIAAVPLMIAIIPGLIVGGMALRRSRAWKNNPVVPDAPRPEMRFKSGPGNRRCSCGKVAVLLKVTRHTHNGVPTGTDYAYKCDSCGNEFMTESAGGMIGSFLAGAMLGTGGVVVLVTATSPLSRFGWGIALSLGGALLFWQVFARFSARFKYPEV